LVVEDEVKIADGIKRGLKHAGYAVDIVADGDSGLSHALDSDYDVIILDRMLPGSIDGLGICRQLRKNNISTPVLMLSARGELMDRVDGLNAGADDYLVKPFSLLELTARLTAILRRPAQHIGVILKCKDLRVDTARRTVTRSGTAIQLTPKEYALLLYLMHNQGQIITKDTIISHLWDGEQVIVRNTVEVYISFLRKKIDKPFLPSEPLIKTIRGVGFRLGKAV